QRLHAVVLHERGGPAAAAGFQADLSAARPHHERKETTMRTADPFILELDVEAPITRRVLERVPADRLGWKPHPRSSSVGQLALHAARLPQAFTSFVAQPSLDILAANRTQAPPDSHEAILAAFDESVAAARGYLAGLD